MRRRLLARAIWRPPAVVTALAAAAAVFAGCGAGDRPGAGARLIITRDFGARTIDEEAVTPITSGLTAMRQLQANAKTETSFGGRYVTAIAGLKQDLGAGRDWLFYVDGSEAPKGAAAWRVKAGEVVQWDFHRWRDVRSGGAIVGAFPRPLSVRGVALKCVPARSDQCAIARDALTAAGVRRRENAMDGAVRVVVGQWTEIATLKDVPDLSRPAATNGAFARFTSAGGRLALELARDDGSSDGRLGAGAGLIAAIKRGDAVTWLVTGVDAEGVGRAARALGRETLKNRFAVAVGGEHLVGLPVAGSVSER